MSTSEIFSAIRKNKVLVKKEIEQNFNKNCSNKYNDLSILLHHICKKEIQKRIQALYITQNDNNAQNAFIVYAI